jgi:hypothetical protein
MEERRWFPGWADHKLGGFFPQCDDPPTIALALAAAPGVAQEAQIEKGNARDE